MSRTDVVLAYPWIDDEGVEHAVDETVTIDPARARSLVASGRARIAPPPAPTPALHPRRRHANHQEARRGQH